MPENLRVAPHNRLSHIIPDYVVEHITGKTLVIASSHGNQKTDAVVNGQPVAVGINAYITRPTR